MVGAGGWTRAGLIGAGQAETSRRRARERGRMVVLVQESTVEAVAVGRLEGAGWGPTGWRGGTVNGHVEVSFMNSWS